MRNAEEFIWVSQVLLLNDQKAFARLMNRYLPHVRRYFLIQTGGNRAASDDLTQETFIRAWKGLKGFKQLSSFGTWLYRIAFNLYYDYAKGTENTLSIEENIAQMPSYAPHEESDRQEQHQQLRQAIFRLSEGEKQCITLFYLEEMSIKEIGAVTGYSASNIKSYLSRGRRHLETILKGESNETDR